MPEHDRLDPRYRPEFQRGYDPAVHGAAAPAEAEHPDAPPATLRSAEEVAGIPVAAPANRAVEGHDDVLGVIDDDASAAPATHIPAPTAAPVWRNPYVIGLLVLGVALIAVGVDRFTWAVDQVTTGYRSGRTISAQPDFVTPQLMWALGPLLAIAGVLTVLGVGFLVAWRWIPRKRHAPRQNGS